MAQVEGFEPPRDFHPLSVFKTDPFSRTWVNLRVSKWWFRPESNQRHEDFQSSALPTELRNQMAVWTGLEPATSAVTGRHSKPTELPDHLIKYNGDGYGIRTRECMRERHVS